MTRTPRRAETAFLTPRSEYVALRIEPSVEFEDTRTTSAPTLVLTLEGSIARLTTSGCAWRVDRARFVVLGPGTKYRVEKVSVVTQLITLEYGKTALELVLRDYGVYIEPPEWDRVLKTNALLPRTRWVDELAHRYRFERGVCLKHESTATRFLETELMKETYFVARTQHLTAERVSALHEGSSSLEKARAMIDANLERPLEMRELARRCHLSESSLLRTFMGELGVTPSEYTRARRLDHALSLLESKRLSITDVAQRTGYTSSAAFSVAFKKRFGCSPSQLDDDRIQRAKYTNPLE